MSWKNFEELEVYKACREFRKLISSIVRAHFPKEEKYLLSAQVLDSSRSVTSALAEGHGRFHFQENIQYCRIARGSLSESLEHMICAFDEGYIGDATLSEVRNQYQRCLRLLNGYVRYLKNRKAS